MAHRASNGADEADQARDCLKSDASPQPGEINGLDPGCECDTEEIADLESETPSSSTRTGNLFDQKGLESHETEGRTKAMENETARETDKTAEASNDSGLDHVLGRILEEARSQLYPIEAEIACEELADNVVAETILNLELETSVEYSDVLIDSCVTAEDSNLVSLAFVVTGKEPSDIRAAAASRLAGIDRDDVRMLLCHVMTKDRDSSVRKAAALALGKTQDERLLGPLCMALTDLSDDVRQSAAEALASLGDARAVGLLALAAKDEENRVRTEAVRAIGLLTAQDLAKRRQE